jgi:hypothetical protein
MREESGMNGGFVGCETLEGYGEGEIDEGYDREGFGCSSEHTVIPSKKGQFVESGNKIPARSDVTSDKNEDGQ